MADSRRSAGGVAPRSFYDRSRPSRVTPYGPSKVPHSRSIEYDPPKVPRPAVDPKFSPLLRPAMDLSKVPPCLHYLYPYGLAFRFLAGLHASTTPCDPPAIGCHSTPPHDSPAIGCLNNPCDSPASSPSCLNNTPSPVSDSEITIDYDGRRCFICDGKRLHSSVQCPCLVLAAQLDVVKDNPPKEWEYYRYVVRNEWEGMDGYGVGFYDPPKKGDLERSAADAMRQYKDGMNMIRMTGLPENNRDPERLCRQLEKKFGPVAHAVVFPDQSFGFVKFVNRDSAQKAIEVLNNYSDCGHLMWAMQSPE